MLRNEKKYEVSWAQFEVCNANTETAFEEMCRLLFNDFFFAGKAILHSDPNNPGVEVQPTMHPESGKRISFQSKYFSTVDYTQIRHSMENAIEHYAGELDRIYLYCNKDITSTSRSYVKIVEQLRNNGIEIELVTNQAILDQAIKNETVAWRYFDQVSLSREWFQEQLRVNLAALGPRYNSDFNVITESEKLLDSFLCNDEAVVRINQVKKDIADKLKNERWKYRECRESLNAFLESIKKLDDITAESVLDCLAWPERLHSDCETDFKKISDLIETKKVEIETAEHAKDYSKVRSLMSEVDNLAYLLELPQQIVPSSESLDLLQKQIVVVSGNAGAGKSHMFAVSAKKLIESGRSVILLLGSNYVSDHHINIQTPEILSLDISIDAIFHKLESDGIVSRGYSYIFIDAINESVHKNIWHSCLNSLFEKVRNYSHIKLAVSVRDGYEKLVFDEAARTAISCGDVASIWHDGFTKVSIKATKEFLNYYGIPFLPSYSLQAEMTNPLFLTLFCKNYSGENFDIFSLFERLIERADEEAQTATGLPKSFPVIHHLINEIVPLRLSKESLSIEQTDLFRLQFWDTYGLTNQKIQFVTSLVRTGLLISHSVNYSETYYLGYNLLEDFVCARSIIQNCPEKTDLIVYLTNELLKVEDGKITNFHNIDIFIIVCVLYANQYRTECFVDVEKNITDEWDNDSIVKRYLESFLWRKADSISEKEFVDFVKSHSVSCDLFFKILIENSTKEHHALNALFLHTTLIDRSLAERDFLWTRYINHLANNEERLFQLIEYFDEGNLLDGLSDSNTELLLILLTWLLTASNRYMRDKASKAAIEILKHKFELCKPMLQCFENVNDPYVLQRLYGIVFGACVKRVEPQIAVYKELVEYVYAHVFDQELVCSDILLRDYARLILERWKYEQPEDSRSVNMEKATPPYRSIEIPTVERQEYYKEGAQNSGFNRIDWSMKINHSECPGMYGDFGRYTFQSALQDFVDVDIVNLYHYAMQYIRDDLGYRDELLGEYDCSLGWRSYSRHDTKKTERIGKKYQWIAFYNILARISDRHLVKGFDEEGDYTFEGPWEPYVRDFDPTLNRNTMHPEDVPCISYPVSAEEDLFIDPDSSPKDIIKWIHAETPHFCAINDKLLVQDDKGSRWVMLYLYDSKKKKSSDIDADGLSSGSQDVWFMAQAFFAKPDQFQQLRQHISSAKFLEQDFPKGDDVYQLFNREYMWSPGCRVFFGERWIDYEIESERYRLVKERVPCPEIEFDPDGNMIWSVVEKEIEKRVPEDVTHVQVMPSYSYVLWEEQYDASQDDATSFHIPCRDLIEKLRLEQKNADGYYYSQDGRLVCFDGSITGICNGLLVREDFLERYLSAVNVKLCWTCIGEKQLFLEGFNQEWSRWNGVYYYENGHGELELHESSN